VSAAARHALALRLSAAAAALVPLTVLVLWGAVGERREEGRRAVTSAARRLELDPELLLAVAEVESGFDPGARSEKGALGILQVMPETGKEVSARMGLRSCDLLGAADNALVGGGYLRMLMDRYRRDLHLSLAAYHAGPARVDEWVDAGRGLPGPEVVEAFAFAETRRYVDDVLRVKSRLESRSGEAR
jgi:soluble lytic murein transglycosylase